MDLLSETEAMLQGLAQDASMSEAPAAGTLAAETVPVTEHSVVQTEQFHEQSGQPAVVQVSQQVDDGKQVTTAAETYVVENDQIAQVAAPTVAVDLKGSGLEQPASALPVPGEVQADSVPDQQPQQAAANGIAVAHPSTSGIPESNSTVDAVDGSAQHQTEPERGRSRKRRARWGPPANQVAEPAATADGEPTGRKKRRSRWEEPTPAADDSQQLAVVDMSNGSGFPHEIVLAGGIKVSLKSQSPAHISDCKHDCCCICSCLILHANLLFHLPLKQFMHDAVLRFLYFV